MCIVLIEQLCNIARCKRSSDHVHSDHAHSNHAHSDHAHSDHEQQLTKFMAEVGSSTSSPGVSLHEGLDKDSKESVNDEERINSTKTR